MRILLASSEVHPYSKTGGLADMVGSLAKALARAGHRVTLIGRPTHVEAIRKGGLRFEGKEFDEHVRLDASTQAEAVRGARLVLVCVKSSDSERAAAEIAPFLETEAIVANLQNGVDNAERIQAVIGRPVIPAVVYVATEMAGPGHLKHHGRGELVIGDAKASRTLVKFDDGITFGWSPDGQRLLFYSNRTGNWDLFVMSATGENVINLTNTPDIDELAPAWRP